MTVDETRSARLLFAEELEGGAIVAADLDRPEVQRAVASRPVPSRPARILHRLAMKRGRLSWESCLTALVGARRAVLGDASGPLRVLVRVDEFPHARAFDEVDRYGTTVFRRFHAIMRNAGVPYLLAVTPRVSHRPLSPRATSRRRLDEDERHVIEALGRDGVVFALHGYDHRTRRRSPRRRSELCGLSLPRLRDRLDRAEAELAATGVHPRVFVPPFNRFDAAQYSELARRYAVVAGGPESVPLLGFRCTPRWWGEAVFMPAYPPLYGRSAEVAAALTRLAVRGVGTWVPIVLHWGWEADAGWRDLERLAAQLTDVARPWETFLAAVEASR